MFALPWGKKHKESYGKKKRLFSYFQAILMSFYSADVYIDVRHRWKGIGIFYVGLVTFFLAIPWSVNQIMNIEHKFNKEIVPAMKQLPNLNIEGGYISASAKQPMIINSPETGKPIIILDTTDTIQDITVEPYKSVMMLINQHAVTTRVSNLPPYTQVLDSTVNGELQTEGAIDIMARIKRLFVWMIFPMSWSLFWSVIFSVYAVFAFIMSMFSKILLRYDINYRDTLRLLCVSSTPQMCLLAVIMITGWNSQGMRYLMFFVTWCYFILAIRANKYASKYLVVV